MKVVQFCCSGVSIKSYSAKNTKNTRKRCEICSKLTIKILQRRQ